MSVDYSTIHKHLKQLKLSNPPQGPIASTQLDEQTAILYISSLRDDLIKLISSNNIITNDTILSSKLLNEIIIFTKTLDYVPKSDKLFSLFDASLFRSLFDLLFIDNLPVEVLRGILRICLTYLAGVIPKTRKQGMFKTLLSVLCEPITNNNSNNNNNNSSKIRCDVLFSNLSSRITFADARMNLNIVDFIAKVLYRLMETIGSTINDTKSLVLEEQWLFNVLRSLSINNFFGSLSFIKGIDEIEGMTGLRGSLDLTFKWLSNKKFDENNFIWIECCNLSKEVGITLNYSNDINNQIELLSILSLIGTLKQPKRSLKKILVECNMTSTFPILKFISSISSYIIKNNNLNQIFGIWNIDLWFSLLNVGTRCWLFSGAKIENNDTDKVINMVEVVIDWLSSKLSVIDKDYDVSSLLEIVDNFNYDKIKKLQLKNIELKRSIMWSNEIKPLENLIHNQVIALIRDQRFSQLSKGSWVYVNNPLDSIDKTYYYLTLNSNSQSIVYKEFNKKPVKNNQTPNLDKDGIFIEFRNIINIISENLNENNDDTGLISIQSERMNVNRIDVVTKTGIFTFYVDTKQLKDIWVDGLRILVADSKIDNNIKSDNIVNIENAEMKLSISEEFFANSGVGSTVRKHIRTLEDIRVRTQMLDFTDDEINIDNSNNDKNADNTNNKIDMSSLSVNFFYD